MNRKTCRLLSFVTVSALCLGIAGCTSDEPDGNDNKVVYSWPLGTSSPEDTVTQVYAEKFAEEVARLSGGEIEINIFPNSTVGNDSELLESCEEGDIPFVVQNTAPQVSYMEEMAVFDLPCVFDTIEQAREAVDNKEFYSKLEDVYHEGGYELLGMADQGFRVLTTNVAIDDISDFAGQKIRTMENSFHLAFWQALGANPTPMAFSEVYIGLQQKTIDAEENPVEVIVSGRLYEQQAYIVETNHLPHYISLFMNNDLFNKLDPEYQEILTTAAQTATEYAREQADERVEDRMSVIEESGTEVIELSDDLRDEMRDASSGVYDEIRACVGDELVDMYISAADQ